MFPPAALDEIEKRFWRDVFRVAVDSEDAFEELGVELKTFGVVQASIVTEQPDEPMLHLVLGAGIPGAVESGDLAAAIEWVQSHEVDYRVPVTPGRTAASDAARWLMEANHELGGSWTKLARDASPPAFEDPDVDVFRRGRNEDETFGVPFAEMLGIPDWASTLFLDLPATEGWHCYVAAEGDDPLAHVAMLIHGGVAELALGANPGSERHAEGQLAVLRRCIDDAAAAGCEAIFTEALAFDSEPLANSRECLQRAGFEQVFARRDWRPPREAVAETRDRDLWFET